MGTRCLTFVYGEDGEKIINLYRQYDGYPTGHGAELAEFLTTGTLVNGLRMGQTGRFFNGAGCLAAQLVCNFKQEAGQFYLYPVTTLDCGQDFEYHIYVDDTISIKVISCGVNFFGSTQSDVYETIFDGNLEQFTKFCADEAEEKEEISVNDIFENSIIGREVLKKELREGVVKVVFEKQDGTERTMLCTLSDDYVPLLDTTGVTSKRARNDEALAVWDTEAEGWRSFRYDSIKSVTIPAVA